jgi:hypothetical protein
LTSPTAAVAWPPHLRVVPGRRRRGRDLAAYGGIHYRRGIDEGLRQGDQVGAAVNALTWRTAGGRRWSP